MVENQAPPFLPALLGGLSGFTDEFSKYIVDWAIRKNFRQPCKLCGGTRTYAEATCTHCGGTACEPDSRNVGEQIALIHSEVSELWEKFGSMLPPGNDIEIRLNKIYEDLDALDSELIHKTGTAPPEDFEHPCSVPEILLKMHQKLSKVLENARKHKPGQKPIMDEHCPQFTNTEIELADIFIRMADFAGAYNLRLGAAIEAKQKFNETRPPKHGKNF